MKMLKTFYEDLTHPEVYVALKDTWQSLAFWGLVGVGFGWAYCYGQSLGHGIGFAMFLNWVFFMLLSAIAVTDLKHFIIPDILVVLLFILGITTTPSLSLALTGSLILGLSFWFVRSLGTKMAGQEAMGLGDVKLVIALGPWIHVLGIVPFLLVASLSALLVVAGRTLLCKKQKEALPFAPFLVLGAWASYAYGYMFFMYLMYFRQIVLGLE